MLSYSDTEFSTVIPLFFNGTFRDFRNIEIDIRISIKEQNHFNCRKTNFKVAESTTSEKGNHSNNFHFKVRKPHFKLRKALYKGGLERNVKNKNTLEFAVEKDVIIFFFAF